LHLHQIAKEAHGAAPAVQANEVLKEAKIPEQIGTRDYGFSSRVDRKGKSGLGSPESVSSWAEDRPDDAPERHRWTTAASRTTTILATASGQVRRSEEFLQCRRSPKSRMASKYDDLDASLELEQELHADLRAALEPRGCEVVHNGANNGGSHAPGGKADIEVRDPKHGRLLLVEVTRRKGSAADGEFPAITSHLDEAIHAGGYDDYCLLYVSPATSPRMSTNLRDLYNRSRAREGRKGRVVGLDFAGTEMMVTKLIQSDPSLYPAERWGALFSHWEKAVDDARTRQVVQETLFPEDHKLALSLENEARELDAERERTLKEQLRKVEDKLRDYGITGDQANETLVYLAFLRLYEERRQRNTGQVNRFTVTGFTEWSEAQPMTIQARYKGRMCEALLHEVAEDGDLQAAGLLRNESGDKDKLHPKITDSIVKRVLDIFDQYDFAAGQVDVLGAVFETLARRSQKDTRVGQFFTPQQVVDFCADIVQLRPTDTVGDLAVGTGRFLIAAMRLMLANADQIPGAKADAEKAIRTSQLLGTDIDAWVATIAKMNMFIHGDGKSGITTANGLVLSDRRVFGSHPDGLEQALDVVLMNPPLGDTSYRVAADDWLSLTPEGDEPSRESFFEELKIVPMRTLEEDELTKLEARLEETRERIQELEAMEASDRPARRYASALKSQTRQREALADLRAAITAGQVTREASGQAMKGGALFLAAISRYLKPIRDADLGIEWRGGRAAVIVDEAILNTPEYAEVRRFIRENFYVKAIVSLARDAFKFLAHTDAKTSVIYLIRKEHAQVVQKEPVFFAHADRVGYSARGSWVGDDLPQIALYYRQFEALVKESYVGAHLDSEGCIAAVKELPGFSSAFFARLDDGGGSGARLDFFDARFHQRVEELETAHGKMEHLGDYLVVAPSEHPAPARTSEYEFATINRNTAAVARRGSEETKYPPQDLQVLRSGELVVSGIDAVNGAVGIVPEELDGLVMSKEMFRYRIRDESEAVPEFLQLLLRTQVAQELLMGLATGTSNRTRLESPEQLLALPIPPLPDLKTQEEVAAQVRQAHSLRAQWLENLEGAHESANAEWRQPERPPALDPRSFPIAEAQLI
jgi:hypothetical protein